ncbi:MAG: hypothetical protein HC804_03035 [Anaerolineae bacterium]|nr:hypothetical protein [Anaerolineae bacterium]
MSELTHTTTAEPFLRRAGGLAIMSGIISTIGVFFLIVMFVLFTTPYKELGMTFGQINDICIAIQYLLTIPLALALDRVLRPYHPTFIRLATVIGIASMIVVILLQLALVYGFLTFEQQVGWVTLAMIGGVGSWLIVTGFVARSTGRLPRSVLMSALAVPYLGYPVWAFWLGRRLLNW